MKRAQQFFGLILFIASYQITNGQDIVVEISGAAGSSTSCANSVSVTLTTLTGNLLKSTTINGTAFVGISASPFYQTSTGIGWQAKIQATGSSCSGSANTGSQIISFDGTCKQSTFTAGTAYKITLIVKVYAPIGSTQITDNSYDDTCGNSMVNLALSKPQHSGVTFDWYVTDDPASLSWKMFRQNALPSIDATVDEIDDNSFLTSKYTERYVRAVGHGCSAPPTSDFVTVKFLPPPPGVTVDPFAPKCHDGSNGQISVAINSPEPEFYNSFVITGNGGLQTDIDNSFSTVISNLSSGTYDLLVEYKLGSTCSTTKSDIILDNPTGVDASLSTSNYNGFNVSCYGSNNGSISVSASGGTGSYSYEWAGGISNTNFASNLVAKFYSIKIYDSNNCEVTKTITLTEPSTTPKVTINSTGGADGFDISCASVADGKLVASAQTEVGGSISYLWNTGYSGSTYSNLGTGTYTITIKDANGCTDTKSRTLTTRPNVSFSISEVNPIECPNKPSGALAATGLANASAPISYLWSSGETSSSISNKLPGDYTLTITDAKGCKASTIKTLANPAGYSVSISALSNYNGSKISCKGNTDGKLGTTVIDLATNLAANPQNYTWYKNGVSIASGAATSSMNSLAAGTYKVVIAYGSACSAESSIFLTEPSAISPGISVPSTLLYNGEALSCTGASDAILKASASGGTGSSYNFLWNTGISGADLSSVSAGTYSVTAKDVNGCSGSVSKTIVDPAAVTPVISVVSNYNGVPISCNSAADGKLRASATGGVGGYSFTWNTGFIGTDLQNVSQGTYSVSVKDANGCTSIANKLVSQPAPVSGSIEILSNFNGQHVSCYNATDGTLRASGSGGVGGYSFSWSNGKNISTISGLGAGTYGVVVKDLNNCLSVPTNEILQNPPEVKSGIVITSNYNGTPISCHGAMDGALKAKGSGGTGHYSYTWATGESGDELTGVAAGDYSVVVSDDNNCKGSSEVHVDEPEQVKTIITKVSNYNGVGVKCHGDSNAFIECSATGGVGGYSFEWLGTSERTNVISNIPAGSYRVRVADLNGCANEGSQEITSSDEIELTVSDKHDPLCFAGTDGRIKVSAIGGVSNYEFQINSAGWNGASDFSGLNAGVFVLEGRDANGCAATITESLSQPEKLVIDFVDIVPAFCKEAVGSARAVVQGGTGAYNLEWRNSENKLFDTDNVISQLASGSYTLSVTDENNCVFEKAVGIASTDGPDVIISSITPAKCSYSNDATIELNVNSGDGPFKFIWDDGANRNSRNDLAKGEYLVTVTDVNNCVTIESVSISAPDQLSIGLVEAVQPSCKGLSDGSIKVFATGGTADYIFSWGLFTGSQINGITAGVHGVTVTDSHGCIETKSFLITEPTDLQVNLVSRQIPTCYNNCDGNIEVSASGANGDYSYEWDDGQTSQMGIKKCSRDHIVTVRDKKGCILKKTFNLGQPNPLQLRVLNLQRTSCFEVCDGAAAITAVGGNGSYVFTWDTGEKGDQRSGLCGKTYFVSVTDRLGCTLKDVGVTVPRPEKLELILADQKPPDCYGDRNGSMAVRATGGTSPYYFAWPELNQKSSVLSGVPEGIYSCVVTDSKKCVSATEKYNLKQPDQLKIVLDELINPTCDQWCDAQIKIHTTGGNGDSKFVWSNANNTSTATALCSGDYRVVVSDRNNCTVTQSYHINETPPLTIELGEPVTLCVGQSHTVEVAPTWAAYNWTSSTGFSAKTSRVTIREAGQYVLEVTSAAGCKAKDVFVLNTSKDLLKAKLLLPAEASVGDTVVMIDASWPLPDNIAWQYPHSMQKVLDLGEVIYGKFTSNGIYDIKLMTSLGECYDEMVKRISIIDRKKAPEGGRLGYEKFVKKFEMFANPNDGSFKVLVELAHEGPIVLSVWSALQGSTVGQINAEGSNNYFHEIDFRPATSGTYVLRLDHEKGYETIRFIVR